MASPAIWRKVFRRSNFGLGEANKVDRVEVD
jgi:hypothetical protein